MTRRRPLARAWLLLLALSLGSTAVALAAPHLARPAAGALLLVLAWGKARVILNDYLGLAAAPSWSRGFGLALGLYMALLLGLALAA